MNLLNPFIDFIYKEWKELLKLILRFKPKKQSKLIP